MFARRRLPVLLHFKFSLFLLITCISVSVYSSDISIPGISSKYQTDKLIEEIMKVERIPLDRLEDRKDSFDAQKSVWQDLNRSIVRFRDSSRELFGFQNPFNARIAKSSNEAAVTASASRQALLEISEIKVLNTASADRFISRQLPRNYRVPEGIYDFSVGNEQISIRYRGGTVEDFARIITERSRNLLRATVVRDTAQTQIFMIESRKTGYENRISFRNDSETFGLDTGLIRSTLTGERKFPGSSESEDGTLTALPQSTHKITLEPTTAIEQNEFLEIQVRIKRIPFEDFRPPSPPPGPQLSELPGITFEGITIHSLSSQVELPQFEVPEPPKRFDTLEVLFADENIPLPALRDTEENQTVRVPASGLPERLSSITIDNRNTHKEIIVSEVRIFNPDARDGFEPVNAASQAGDAIVEINGIQVVRPGNEIDDLIPGVTLNLIRSSVDPVEISVEPDRDRVKESIISFIGLYNSLLKDIHILTSNDPSVIDEIDYLTSEERDTAMERLGLFSGDTTLGQLRNRLQRIMMDPYPTSLSGDLSLLAQIGISTNSSGFGGGIDTTRLRGYLEINEAVLDEALGTRLSAIKDLFGKDTTGDLAIDSGAAFAADQYISLYSQTGGIISTRIAGIDRQIERTNRDITTYQVRLERTEADLRRKYGIMEGAMRSLEDSSRSIENFNRAQSQ